MASIMFKIALLAVFIGMTYATAATTAATSGVTQCYSCTGCSSTSAVVTCATSASDTNTYACYKSGASFSFLVSVSSYVRGCMTVEGCNNQTTVGAVGFSAGTSCCYSNLCNFSLSQMKSSSMTTLLILAFASLAVYFRSV